MRGIMGCVFAGGTADLQLRFLQHNGHCGGVEEEEEETSCEAGSWMQQLAANGGSWLASWGWGPAVRACSAADALHCKGLALLAGHEIRPGGCCSSPVPASCYSNSVA